MIGALEAPSYPINNQVVTSWFPDRERAGAIGFYTSGQFIGLAFLTPMLVAALELAGAGCLSSPVSWAWCGSGIWFSCYRDPRVHTGVNEAELDLIVRGGGLIDTGSSAAAGAAPLDWGGLGRVFRYKKPRGLYIGQFSITTTQWFFLTWFPTYLVQARGMTFVKAGFLATLPFLAAFIGVLCSGLLSDALVRRGMSLGAARKTPIVAGLLLSASIIGANYVDTPALIIAYMTLAFFGNGLASITWSLVSAIAPERLLGLDGRGVQLLR